MRIDAGLCLSVFGLATFLSSPPAEARTFLVPAEVLTIQEAMNLSMSGDTILVSPGEHGIEKSIDFSGKAIAVKSVKGPRETVIRMRAGPYAGSVVIFQRREGPASVLEGFTLTGGLGTQMGSLMGGGILCLDGASPTLRNLVVTENSATYGGGLFCQNSSPRLEGCTLSRNRVSCGGGAYCSNGSAPVFVGCTIRGNRGSYASSGVHSKGGSTPLLIGCRIIGNMTVYGGGVDSFQSSPTLVNCIIAGNFAQYGGAAYIASDSMMALTNCTIASNSAYQGNGVHCMEPGSVLTNCIFWNKDQDMLACGICSSLIGRDPLFVNPGSFDLQRFAEVSIGGTWQEMPDFVLLEPDFHLLRASPAIDLGTGTGSPAVDIEGNQRPCGIGIDAGAYEHCSLSPDPFLRGDPNADGSRDLADPVLVLDHLFLRSPIGIGCMSSADANDDGLVNISDALMLLFHLFGGKSQLPEPFLSCGPDPGTSPLPCESYPPCSSPN